MKHLFAAVLLLTGSLISMAQDVNTSRNNAYKFMQTGDFDNALVILNKAYSENPGNIALQKDLALAHYYKKDNQRALDFVKILLDRPDADEQCYQIAGNVYRQLNNAKETEKIYKTALKKFPGNGALNSEYGEYLDMTGKSKDAIAVWETGIRENPSYSGNYYNAAIYYFKQPDDLIWAIIYGEIYANMESLNPKSSQIKAMVLDAYKQKLFANSNLNSAAQKSKNEFEKAVLETFSRQSGITVQGLTPETLAMIRTRFILDWNNSYAAKFPYYLFEYHTQLMKDGLFDSYNQWMFGPASNMDAFKNWAELNKANYDRFTEFHKGRIFKMPKGQFYK
ncbi:MAG: hypothetical protein QM727_14520 [Niabella sp.]